MLPAGLRAKARSRISRGSTARLQAGAARESAVQRWAAVELGRSDPFQVADAGVALRRYVADDALERIALPVAVVVTTQDEVIATVDQRRPRRPAPGCHGARGRLRPRRLRGGARAVRAGAGRGVRGRRRPFGGLTSPQAGLLRVRRPDSPVPFRRCPPIVSTGDRAAREPSTASDPCPRRAGPRPGPGRLPAAAPASPVAAAPAPTGAPAPAARTVVGFRRRAARRQVALGPAARSRSRCRSSARWWRSGRAGIAAGDNALIGIRVRDILHGHLPLIGQPSTGDNLSDALPSSHPGPLEFYLLAPFTALLGPHAGMAVGAAAINSTALVAVVWAAFRRGGMVLASLVATATFVATVSIGVQQLHDPLSSEIGIWPALAMVLLTWGVLADDRGLLVPFVLAATFAMQAHLSYLSFGAPFVLLVLVVTLFRMARELRAERVSWRWWPRWTWVRQRPFAVASFLGVVLWMPPFVEQFTAKAGNITAIMSTLGAKGEPGRGGASRSTASPWPSPRVPYFVGRHANLAHLQSVGWLARGLAVRSCSGWVPCCSPAAGPSARRPGVAMAVCIGLAVLAGVTTAAALPGAGTLKVANFRWIWVVGVLVWSCGAWLLYELADVPAGARARCERSRWCSPWWRRATRSRRSTSTRSATSSPCAPSRRCARRWRPGCRPASTGSPSTVAPPP